MPWDEDVFSQSILGVSDAPAGRCMVAQPGFGGRWSALGATC